MINQLFYEITTSDLGKIPDDNLPEYPIVGKSNVGKSTFINFISGQKRLAYTSSKPGKTRNISTFELKNKARIVDLPGYGYSSTSKLEKQRFSKLVEDYFESKRNIRNVFLLVDIKRCITDDELTMVAFLKSKNLKFKIIGTKLDKYNQSVVFKFKKEIVNYVGKNDYILTSFKTRKNIDLFKTWFNNIIN